MTSTELLPTFVVLEFALLQGGPCQARGRRRHRRRRPRRRRRLGRQRLGQAGAPGGVPVRASRVPDPSDETCRPEDQEERRTLEPHSARGQPQVVAQLRRGAAAPSFRASVPSLSAESQCRASVPGLGTLDSASTHVSCSRGRAAGRVSGVKTRGARLISRDNAGAEPGVCGWVGGGGCGNGGAYETRGLTRVTGCDKEARSRGSQSSGRSRGRGRGSPQGLDENARQVQVQRR
jgi:hypothetical protein